MTVERQNVARMGVDTTPKTHEDGRTMDAFRANMYSWYGRGPSSTTSSTTAQRSRRRAAAAACRARCCLGLTPTWPHGLVLVVDQNSSATLVVKGPTDKKNFVMLFA